MVTKNKKATKAKKTGVMVFQKNTFIGTIKTAHDTFDNKIESRLLGMYIENKFKQRQNR